MDGWMRFPHHTAAPAAPPHDNRGAQEASGDPQIVLHFAVWSPGLFGSRME